MTHVLTLLDKHFEGGNVWSFRFEPSQALQWQAGQFIRVNLPHTQPDSEGTQRSFTITSAPAERLIQITTRQTVSTFKQTLANLPVGGQLEVLDLPSGDFTWRDSPHPLIFVAQGIGITPFISLLRQRAHDQQPLTAHLFYANLTAHVPFASELADWTLAHPELQLTHSREPITATALAAQVPHLKQSLVYISGPRPLFELLLPPYNLSPHQLKQDQFPNYPVNAY